MPKKIKKVQFLSHDKPHSFQAMINQAYKEGWVSCGPAFSLKGLFWKEMEMDIEDDDTENEE